jgi:hypothetical protein
MTLRERERERERETARESSELCRSFVGSLIIRQVALRLNRKICHHITVKITLAYHYYCYYLKRKKKGKNTKKSTKLPSILQMALQTTKA